MLIGKRSSKIICRKDGITMKKCFNSLLSYTLSVVSGLFLVSGIAVLSAGR